MFRISSREQQAANIDNKFGAINVTEQISKKWSLSAFGVISSNTFD
jgi:hypothetical protein